MIINQIKTVLLLVGLSAIMLLLGSFIGGITGITIALVMALLMNGFAYFFSDKMVLYMYGAQPLDQSTHNRLYHIVGELAEKMNLPMPKLFLIDTPMANAFATGRNPQNASVAVTTGIITILDERELRGVLAHELAHIKNRDILIATVAATIATAISYMAHIMQHIAIFGSSDNNRKRGNNPLSLLLVAIVVPIAATLVQLAISRSREYIADETGARHAHDPLALAHALEKLHQQAAFAPLQDQGRASTASLFIVNPFSTGGLIELLSTHPPVHQRIERLHRLHETMF
jgi:heat shock protein HtpX